MYALRVCSYRMVMKESPCRMNVLPFETITDPFLSSRYPHHHRHLHFYQVWISCREPWGNANWPSFRLASLLPNSVISVQTIIEAIRISNFVSLMSQLQTSVEGPSMSTKCAPNANHVLLQSTQQNLQKYTTFKSNKNSKLKI